MAALREAWPRQRILRPRRGSSPRDQLEFKTSQYSNVFLTLELRCSLLTRIRTEYNNKAPYMGLSAEIWLQICRLVVEKELPIAVRFKHVNPPPRKFSKPTIAPRLPDCRTALALASTSRWMYKTVVPIYYGKNTFRLPTRHVDMDKFFASIGPRSLDLITSLELATCNYIRGLPTKLPLQKISTMAAITHISISYTEGVMNYLCLGSGPNRVIFHAVTHYNQFIELLSEFSNEKGEPGKRIDGTDINSRMFSWLTPVDQENWTSFEKIYCKRILTSTTYSWGVVEGNVYGHPRNKLNINVERHAMTRN